MIKIIVDDKQFYVSDVTLTSNPNFIVSKMIKDDTLTHPLIQKLGNDYVIDADSTYVEKIINEMRQKDYESLKSSLFIDTHDKKDNSVPIVELSNTTIFAKQEGPVKRVDFALDTMPNGDNTTDNVPTIKMSSTANTFSSSIFRPRKVALNSN